MGGIIKYMWHKNTREDWEEEEDQQEGTGRIRKNKWGGGDEKEQKQWNICMAVA